MLDILIGRGQNGPDSRDKVGLGSIRRPVIGLALGGGAARGFAHIGIVRTLIAHGIVPNVVVGTSIGAVVGGAYASGHLDTLEEWARSLQPPLAYAGSSWSTSVVERGTTPRPVRRSSGFTSGLALRNSTSRHLRQPHSWHR